MAKRASSSLDPLELSCSPETLPESAIYVIFGPEALLRDRSLRAIRARVLGTGGDDFAESRLDGSAVILADVMDELATPSFFSPVRVVVVQDADDFVSKYRAKLEGYFQRPAGSGVLVLLVQSWPSNTRLAKIVAKVGTAVDCRPPHARQIPSWCKQWARIEYGKKIAADALSLLIELTPGGLSQLDCELAKLSCYLGKRDTIEVQDVDQLVASGRMEQVWNIVDFAIAGETPRALQILDGLISGGEYPLMLLGALSAQLRRLARAHQLVREGSGERAALLEAGIREFVVAKAQGQLRRLGPMRLNSLYRWLLHTDLGMKGESGLTPRQLLERLVIRLAA